MSDIPNALRVAGGGLLAAGVLAAGAAAGAAIERAIVTRASKPDDDWQLEPIDAEVRELTMSDGTMIHVEIDAPEEPSDLTVIFCHGYALSLDSWTFQRRALLGRARIVSYDQRSHGSSGRGEFDSHHVDQLGSDLAEIIDAVAPTGPLILIGHSMGGMTIMALAEQRPALFTERIFGVALVSTTAGGLSQSPLGLPAPLGRAVMRAAPVVASTLARQKDAVERGRRSSTDLSLLITRLYSFGSAASDQAGRFVARMIDATPIDVLAEFLPALQEHDKRHVLPLLQHAEVLVIVGDADRLTPLAHSEQIVAAIPGAEFVVIPNGGHMAMIEFHERVDALLIGFVDRVRRNLATGAA